MIAADVGSLKDEVVEGTTGFVCEPRNAAALARAIQAYFKSDLYHGLNRHRPGIRDFADERYSWHKVAAITTAVYSKLAAKNESHQRAAR